MGIWGRHILLEYKKLGPLSITIILIPFVISILLLLLGLIARGISRTEKYTPFECGFDPLVGSRSPFTTRYFLLVIIFLIFDVELSLMFPVVSLVQLSQWISLSLPLVVAVLMLGGIIHEKNEGRIQWMNFLSSKLSLSSRAHNSVMTNVLNKIIYCSYSWSWKQKIL